MNDNAIFAKFKEICKFTDDEVIFYIHNGFRSIRIRLSDEYTELVFTYVSDDEWRLETMHSYLHNICECDG